MFIKLSFKIQLISLRETVRSYILLITTVMWTNIWLPVLYI